MNTIHQLLQTHLTKYPLMELADMVKLLYQNAFGPGHMVSDPSAGLQNLYEEWENIPHSSSGFFSEPIGNGLVRVYLETLKKEELPVLNAMFCQTAGQVHGSLEKFIRSLDILPLYYPDAESFLSEYRKRGYPPVSHSASYRLAYRPAYRVVLQSHAVFLRLIRTLDSSLQKNIPLILAIDGNCASGKTTLSRLLAMYFDCNIIPMDDFFLPPALRTAERLAQPGGNVHYERFIEEVMKPLQNGSEISYRRFRCDIMDYGDAITLPPKPLTIIEGSYCMRPELRGLYHYSVFLSCSYEHQIARIRARNGEEMLKNFISRWIPLENAYFDAFQVKKSCSLVIKTDENFFSRC